MKKTLLLLSLLLIALACFAQTPVHTNFVTFNKNTPTTGTIRWSAEPSANVNYYYLAIYPTSTMYFSPSYCDPAWNLPGDYLAAFVLDSPGVFKLDVTGLNPTLEYYAYVAAVETGGWTWSAYSSWEPPITLPVELSSFTAILTADYFVNLTWVTESETEVLGFNVLRSETNNAADAIQINSSLVAGTNSSTTHTYSLEDAQVESGTTYYYWLQNLDMNGASQLYGPQTVTVTDTSVPTLPEISTMGNAFPNPFNANGSTTIDISVKENETALLTVYNVRGQMMTRAIYKAGEHQFNWSGKNCASGIYFYKLSTPTSSIIKKMMVVR
jgi:hypothetical protein